MKELRDGDNQRTYERWKKESFNKMNRAKAQSKWKEKKYNYKSIKIIKDNALWSLCDHRRLVITLLLL